MNDRAIRVFGARQNNLKGFDIEIPHGQLVVVSGVSGSGKSSLAFDILYAEGQRRYVESFSAYARQFLDRMDRPAVDRIEGILPAIAIDQTDPVRSSRSTVGTMTECNDYLKVLMSRVAKLHCRRCGEEVASDAPETIAARLSRLASGSRCVITFPFDLPKGWRWSRAREELTRLGFTRLYHEGRVEDLAEHEAGRAVRRVEVVIDRIVPDAVERPRLIDSIEQAMGYGGGRLGVHLIDGGRSLRFSAGRHCAPCDIDYRPPGPSLFSFNNPLGACADCKGFGRVIECDMAKVIPDRSLSLSAGAIRPWTTQAYRTEAKDLAAYCGRNGIPMDVPFAELPEEQRRRIIDGDDQVDWYGVRGFFEWLERKSYKMHIRVLLSRYRGYAVCGACHGARLNPDALLYRLDGMSLPQIWALPVGETARFFDQLSPGPFEEPAAAVLLREIRARLDYLVAVGLEYLTLDRQSRTLSGGEVQRVNLTTALGSSLVNTLYVLDEPSIGLHPRDNRRLIRILEGLRDLGNTVVVVEHEPDVMRAADRIIDLGPGAGIAGGRVIANAPAADVIGDPASLTGRYLSGRAGIPVPPSRRQVSPGDGIRIAGASCHNIRALALDVPLNALVCITGVSGSGKSTLVESILHDACARGLAARARGAASRRGAPPAGSPEEGVVGDEERAVVDSVVGLDRIEGCVMVDQSPIGRTPRANPATYMKAFESIRLLMAGTPAARRAGLSAGAFSFNSPGGRCGSCRGEGFHRVEMQFLSDVFIECSDCRGRRYRDEILSIEWGGRNISGILDLTAAEAMDFFPEGPSTGTLRARLRPMHDVGLGYLRLGQPINTLSGGEAQRLKLARHLSMGEGGKRLFLFDEPTTGLHFEDVRVLLEALDRLIRAGNSVIVIEHNLEVIKCADWVIDLGPGAGDAGGRVVAVGTPEDIARAQGSHTGRFLDEVLHPGPGGPVPPPGPAEPAAAAPDGTPGAITIVGAREHNLKGIDVVLPRDRLVVVTGLSGSGKSTLAFDILFAEGQRRYIDSLSAYARQYIMQLHRPDVDRVNGVPPTVSIEQRTSQGGRKSTVATVTEIYHYLRLLWARVGRQHCHVCGIPVASWSIDEMVDDIVAVGAGRLARIFAPVVVNRKGIHRDVIERLRDEGLRMARIDGRFRDLRDIKGLARFEEHSIDALIGLVEVDGRRRATIRGLVERALDIGGGGFWFAPHGAGSREQKFYASARACPRCRHSFAAPDPHHFSFNSRHGACPECAGYGVAAVLRRDLEAREDGAEVDEGAFEAPEGRDGDGDGETGACAACGGARIRAESRAVTVDGRGIHEVTAMPVSASRRWCDALNLRGREGKIAAEILREIGPRLTFLERVGLGYLSLDRGVTTLSGGEAQRIRLAAQLGSNLRGVCYILDEPTIGLHPQDNERLIDTLRDLRDRGNTIIVVEHDEETIRAADWVLDLGPGAGRDGGHLVAAGPLEAILAEPASPTGRCLAGSGARRPRRPRPWRRGIGVKGAREHNLRGFDVTFPAGVLTCVTGVSGSGKSTLVRDILYRAMRRRIHEDSHPAGAHRRITGDSEFTRVIEVDQSPIGKTPRSIPASYVGFFDEIRRVFARVPDARARGYTSGRFSFNVKGGRCESCAGQGAVRMEMSFLPDVRVDCVACEGRRYNADTLEIRFKGRSMADVLAMTIAEAVEFFENIPKVARFVGILNDLGLGYLTLGQPSPTLSGGEAQRIRLAEELGKPSRGSTLYVLDEPTTGLHMADVRRLLDALHRLVTQGNTVVLIEHNMDVIAEADHIIDLGPGGGDDGGRVVATGTPEKVSRVEGSLTGRHLLKFLEVRGRAVAGRSGTGRKPPDGRGVRRARRTGAGVMEGS